MNKIHTTIGIYPNGSFKTNGVSEANLQSHIWYNKSVRPGRVLIVDGVVAHDGCLKPEYLEELLSKIPISSIKIEEDTVPYH